VGGSVRSACEARVCRGGQNHIIICIYVCTVISAGKCPYIQYSMVYTNGSGHTYTLSYPRYLTQKNSAPKGLVDAGKKCSFVGIGTQFACRIAY